VTNVLHVKLNFLYRKLLKNSFLFLFSLKNKDVYLAKVNYTIMSYSMNLINKVSNIIRILVYGLALFIALFSEISIYKLAIPALSLDLILTISNLLLLTRKENSNSIELFWSDLSGSSSKWFFLVLIIIIGIFQFIDPKDFQGWFWLGLFSIRLIERFHPKFNWDLMIENNKIIFPNFWRKSIKLSEIENLENFADGLKIKSNNGTTKIYLSKDIAESIKLKIQSGSPTKSRTLI